jgi:hypothetical protein
VLSKRAFDLDGIHAKFSAHENNIHFHNKLELRAFLADRLLTVRPGCGGLQPNQ